MRARRRRRFVDLRSAEILPALLPRLFLGRFDGEELCEELRAAGILDGLARRGHPDAAVSTDYEVGEHRLRVDSAAGGPSLVDLRLAEGTTLSQEPLLRERGLEVLSFLAIHWLSLQDPSRDFDAARPRLPGQRHPGLGLARPILALVLGWARAWGKDGVLALPEYYHNAVFYSPQFRFVAPVRQGRFEALVRDLGRLPVAEASAAVAQARVVEEPWGAPFKWEPGEMIAPLGEAAAGFLASMEYRQASERARQGARFRLR